MNTLSPVITSTNNSPKTSSLIEERIDKLDKQVTQLEKQTADWRIIVLVKNIFYAFKVSYQTAKDKIYKAYDFIYAKNRVSGERGFWLIPTWLEKRIGENSYPKVVLYGKGQSIRPEVNDLISNIKTKLVPIATKDCPDFEYEIKAVRSFHVISQYTLGGKVTINEGLIDQIAHEKESFGLGNLNLTLEDKIAAVISRRLINTCAGHFYPSSIENVLDADHYGMHYLNKAGYNPAASLWLLQYFLKITTPKLHKSPNYLEKLIRSYYDPTIILKLRLEKLKLSYTAIMEANGQKVTFPKDFGISNVVVSEIGKEPKETKNNTEIKEFEKALNLRRKLERILQVFQIFLKI